MIEGMYDYFTFGRCQAAVDDRRQPSGESECGEPATYTIWWEAGKQKEMVCVEHFKMYMANMGLEGLRKKIAAYLDQYKDGIGPVLAYIAANDILRMVKDSRVDIQQKDGE